MPLKFSCPRCKTALTLPRNLAGSYTKCAHCGGRIWVPEMPGSESSPPSSAAASSSAPPSPVGPSAVAPIPSSPPSLGAVPPGGPPPGGPPPMPTSPHPLPPNSLQAGPMPPPVAPGHPVAGHPVAGHPVAGPSVSAPLPQTLPPQATLTAASPAASGAAPWTAAGQSRPSSPSVGASGGKARFVTAATAESRLQPMADGKLPGLKLEQDEPAEKPAEKTDGAGIHPLVLFCALCLSVLVSITMVLVDVEGPQTDRNREQTQARWTIERDYFSHLDPNQPLAPYQLLLRDAQRAHSRGNQPAERDAYRAVLRLLRAERGRFEGLTGSPKSDRDLEELITTVLRE